MQVVRKRVVLELKRNETRDKHEKLRVMEVAVTLMKGFMGGF